MAFKIGDNVKQIAPVITGGISDIEYNKETGALRYFVEYTDGSGEVHARWFNEDEIEGAI
jgi:hypothetical protein